VVETTHLDGIGLPSHLTVRPAIPSHALHVKSSRSAAHRASASIVS
jgi:hypothetical protein